tara:strand:- start:527 stop:673 length:147 start_codon:yes stop_codon:yes gene_type:complete
MKIIVLLIIVITTYSCGIKTKISCNVNDVNNVIEDCKEQPKVGVSKSF